MIGSSTGDEVMEENKGDDVILQVRFLLRPWLDCKIHMPVASQSGELGRPAFRGPDQVDAA
jgi:hypothetical protein